MSRLLLIAHTEGGREIALLDDRRLIAHAREEKGKIEAEQIYLGAVDRMVKGLESCFVRLGPDRTGFLPFSECPVRPRSGDLMLVQVKKPPVGEKAAYLTQDISLAGRYVILTPLSSRCAVSRRVAEERERARLLDLAQRLRPKDFGLVMRSESADAGEDDVRSEIAALAARWENILKKRAAASGPQLLEDRPDALSRLLRDGHESVDLALCDDPSLLPPLPFPVQACPDPMAVHGVPALLEKSLRRKMWLDCGGYLVIDKTEALTVIDVNSGKFTGGKAGTEDAFLRLNLEAAREIGRLLRLRNIGGIVIVDFVDMETEESRAKVRSEMESVLRLDPNKCVVHGFTSLGLMELTRKKTEESQ